jgi:hypothetical protein
VLQPQQSPSITESLLNHIQRYLRKISGAIVPQPKAKHRSETRITKTTIRTEITRTAIDPAQPLDFGTPTEITTTQKQSAPPVNRVNHTEVETAFDWIETPATHVEYVLTWWQKILKGLDTFVLWIEQKIIAIWHWLTGRN